MTKANKKRADQLGMPFGTANNRLRKTIVFMLLEKLKLNICYRCKKEIETVDELSIEHKTSWLDSDNPKELFFDLENIGFSHLSCNCKAGRKPFSDNHNKWMYEKGCRCKECISAKKEDNKKHGGSASGKNKDAPVV